jgi:hypothetical protein
VVNNVIGVVNYVTAARPTRLNFVIADSQQRVGHHASHSADSRLEVATLAAARPVRR